MQERGVINRFRRPEQGARNRAYRSAELAEPALDPPGLPLLLVGVGGQEERELTHNLDDRGGEFGLGAFQLRSRSRDFSVLALFNNDGVCPGSSMVSHERTRPEKKERTGPQRLRRGSDLLDLGPR